MPTEEIEKLVTELRNWCAQKHGRQVEIARHLGIKKQHIQAWLAGKHMPGTKHYFKIRDFLAQQK